MHGARRLMCCGPSTSSHKLLMNDSKDIEAATRHPDSLTDKELLKIYLLTSDHETGVRAIANKAYGIRRWGIDDTIEASFMMFLNLLIEQPSGQQAWKDANGKLFSRAVFLLIMCFGLWIVFRFKIGFYGGVFVVSSMFLVVYGLAKMVRDPVTTKQQRTRDNMCRSCGYSLHGLGSVGVISVEGNELDIGPDVCPECGSAYPRLLNG